MKIGVLGAGSWGFTLAHLLASKEYEVVCWMREEALYKELSSKKRHPLFPDTEIPENIRWTLNLDEAVFKMELLVESVTSKGIVPVFSAIDKRDLACPIVISSKGIDQETLLTLPELLLSLLGDPFKPQIGLLSGPSFAKEVIHKQPTSVVASSYGKDALQLITTAFNTPTFRVYPNSDITGVALGGAIKNVIAVACGISDGMHLGNSARAALMTRGLHEIRKLSLALGARQETLNGLSGMGDLILTCSSSLSRNYSFGKLLAQGKSNEEAKEQIGMVVEGSYAAASTFALAQKLGVPMPISEAIYLIINENLSPKMALQQLMQRQVKEEHL